MTSPPSTFSIKRAGDIDVVFDGICLVNKSSRQGERQSHWTEIRIYRTNSGKYVTEVVGKTTVAGQKDRISVTVLDSADAVKEALKRRSDQAFEHDSAKTGRPYLTDFAIAALSDAAVHDEALAATLIERI